MVCTTLRGNIYIGVYVLQRMVSKLQPLERQIRNYYFLYNLSRTLQLLNFRLCLIIIIDNFPTIPTEIVEFQFVNALH